MPYGMWYNSENNNREHEFVVDDGITETVPIKITCDENDNWRIIAWDMPDDIIKDTEVIYNDAYEAKYVAGIILNRLGYMVEK